MIILVLIIRKNLKIILVLKLMLVELKRCSVKLFIFYVCYYQS
jgi:hypothetical protein